MRFCTKCGKENKTNDAFCGGCGEKFQVKNNFCVGCGSALQNNSTFCVSCRQRADSAVVRRPPPKKKSSAGMLVGICALVLAVAIAGIFFVLQGDSEDNGSSVFPADSDVANSGQQNAQDENQGDTSEAGSTSDSSSVGDRQPPAQGSANSVGNTTGNISNGGFVAEYGGRIFFAWGMLSDEFEYFYADYGIYSMNMDGSDKRRISYDLASQINVADGRVFYVNQHSDDRIYSMNIDGSDRRRLSNERPSQGSLHVVGGRIFYIYHEVDMDTWNHYNRIYSRSLDGSDRRRLSDGGDSGDFLRLYVTENHIFYVIQPPVSWGWDAEDEPSRLYSMNFDGSDRRMVMINDQPNPMRNLNSVGNRIFFTEQWGLFSMNFDGSDRRRISYDFSPQTINVIEDRIFFVSSDYDMGIYSVNFDGSDRRRLSDARTFRINIVGNRVFYLDEPDWDEYEPRPLPEIRSMNFDGSDNRPAVEEGFILFAR